MSQPLHVPKQVEDNHLPRQIQKKRLFLVLVLTGSMMVVEGVAGFLTNSLALISDAFHMLSHFISTGISLIAIYIALMKAPSDKTYRYWRVEVLAALFNGFLLIPIVGVIAYEAFNRFNDPLPIKEIPMLVVAVVGLVTNIICASILMKPAKKDLNVKSVYMHMLIDAFSSIGVLAGAVILFFTKAYIVDTLVAVVIAILTLFWAIKLIKDSVLILLESVPTHMKINDVESAIKNIGGVKNVHDIHVWVITSGMYALTAHVELEQNISVSETTNVTHLINKALDDKFDITHTCLQYELQEKKQS